MEVSPRACNEIDDRLWDAGEEWVSDNREIELDRLMTAREIADRFGLEVHNIRRWADRHPDKVKKYRDGSRVLFKVREILEYCSGQ